MANLTSLKLQHLGHMVCGVEYTGIPCSLFIWCYLKEWQNRLLHTNQLKQSKFRYRKRMHKALSSYNKILLLTSLSIVINPGYFTKLPPTIIDGRIFKVTIPFFSDPELAPFKNSVISANTFPSAKNL